MRDQGRGSVWRPRFGTGCNGIRDNGRKYRTKYTTRADDQRGRRREEEGEEGEGERIN